MRFAMVLVLALSFTSHTPTRADASPTSATQPRAAARSSPVHSVRRLPGGPIPAAPVGRDTRIGAAEFEGDGDRDEPGGPPAALDPAAPVRAGSAERYARALQAPTANLTAHRPPPPLRC